jgi:hypothetical protein
MNDPAANCRASKPKGFPLQHAAGNYQVKISSVLRMKEETYEHI